MFRRVYILAMALALVAGCKFSGDAARVSFSDSIFEDLGSYQPATDVGLTPSEPFIEHVASFESFEAGPLEDFNFAQQENYLRLGLDECIKRALADSPVIRELGGLILRAPDSATTRNDPSLAYVDPRFGEEAALSQFDANWNSQLLFKKNDGLFNNLFIGDEGSFQQDLAKYRTEIEKFAATGGQFKLSHVVDYEKNNSPSNRFNGNRTDSYAYDAFFEAGFRQPLLQGAGVDFNRIAGPNNQPGVYNGILIARADTDVALADFEMRVRDLVSDVENTYWDLYFAYRDLEAKVEARNGAYDIWRNVEANKGDKSAAIIGQAKEQYYRFAAEVEDAIHGRLTEGTQTNNGSSSGTFRRSGGVRTAERRLRLITGMKLNDSQLVVPSETPVDASSIFDWPTSRASALSIRPELRRQKWRIKRRELELLASQNHLLPRLDVLGKYRLKGFGHDLFGDGNELIEDGTLEEQLDSSAYGTLANGNLQEWELGVDMSVPLGFRRGHAAKRHAELNLARERSILKEQQRQIIFGLSNAMGELVRTSRVRDANLSRLKAANEQFEAIQNIWREQDTTIDLVLEAQRRVIEAKLQYFQTQVEYMLALKAVHYEEGSLFDYHNIVLTEGAASRRASQQASRRASSLKRSINYGKSGLRTSTGPAATSVSPVAAPVNATLSDTTFSDVNNPNVIPGMADADEAISFAGGSDASVSKPSLFPQPVTIAETPDANPVAPNDSAVKASFTDHFLTSPVAPTKNVAQAKRMDGKRPAGKPILRKPMARKLLSRPPSAQTAEWVTPATQSGNTSRAILTSFSDSTTISNPNHPSPASKNSSNRNANAANPYLDSKASPASSRSKVHPKLRRKDLRINIDPKPTKQRSTTFNLRG